MSGANYALKEEIRDYWSERAATFDQAFGHRIPAGPERAAWLAEFRARLGEAPLSVLELACGTGELTGVLRELGHRVTALDFSEAMLARARAKHAGDPAARFFLADAEHTREAPAQYDAVTCRHLVWTLTDPAAALADWFRVLKPGGQLLVFDGDFSAPRGWRGDAARRLITWLEQRQGADPVRTPEAAARGAAIQRQLPFAGGLTFERLRPLAEAAGFTAVTAQSYGRILAAQRRQAAPRDWLRTFLFHRFILHARKPA
ncbi:class I SAM-dependent methyltransferase [Teichococcus vastitatis]|uniref:Class I SAM-dependent methyltransferase n=1 Tax=Teichococcus vastitatis TaxID=2307076 RepID=A0ABS9W029_9PROT|nr:class I SAM-dependent methyltransferase [Pseudoroseomonas vastitatis]MCI0752245.1 class I SAM-dependent methyltransferase [Pseudoroseomonas vastitatis]